MNIIISLNGIEKPNYYEFTEWTDLSFPMHCHYTCEIAFVLSGNITIEKENEVKKLAVGDAVFIMPFEKHSYVTGAEEHSQIFTFQIQPKLISTWDMCLAGKRFRCFSKHFPKSVIHETYRSLKNTDGNLIELNYIFFRIVNNFLCENELVASYQPNNISLEALYYISKNFKKNITLKGMANELNVSYVYLSRVFSKKIKLKFVECVNSFRLQEAIILLSNPEKNMTEICYECGFGSQRQFNRVFRETLLCTPGEYRKKLLSRIDITPVGFTDFTEW